MKLKSLGGSAKKSVLRRLAALYGKMGDAYGKAASSLGLSCDGCERNCCVSYFQHHTYVEWLYVFEGLRELDEATRASFLERAAAYEEEARAALSRGEIPSAMCPVNVDGRCGLYGHRLMICRLHGVPNAVLTGGAVREFPGCWRSQELTVANPDYAIMDRTPLYKELAALEMELLGAKRGRLPRVDMTLAQMLLAGPPKL